MGSDFSALLAGCSGAERKRKREDQEAHEKAKQIGQGLVPIFVMMPLDTVTEDGGAVNDLATRKSWLQGLKAAGVTGVMVDVWWGLCEPSAGQYNWVGYLELVELLKEIGLKLQAVMSFHACGGNVGDSVNIPIPTWALEPARKGGLLYRDAEGAKTEECLSLSADGKEIFAGKTGVRTALACYREYMAAFGEAFGKYLGSTIVEIQVGMGPCGELRYPSYQMSQGWNYPGVGLIMAHDDGMTQMLKEAAAKAGHPEYEKVPAGCPKNTSGGPDDAPLFASRPGAPKEELFRHGHGRFFLHWYHKTLVDHGEAVLREAVKAFPVVKGSDGPLAYSVKVSGIHWHSMHPSRAAETCAGYVPNPDSGSGAYLGIANMLSKVADEVKKPIFFNFTCLEMSNAGEGPGCVQANSAPEDLIAEVRRACITTTVPLCGENALQFGLPEAPGNLKQIYTQLRGWSTGNQRMHAVTLLRLDDGFARPSSLATLKRWIETL
mmetsp:Transcript_12690/g.33519  ORF Transcript_12690/g.33519 Transcript_12690/m.33519 type:complete len:492 (+) Transcript_12690:74-1549(+)